MISHNHRVNNINKSMVTTVANFMDLSVGSKYDCVLTIILSFLTKLIFFHCFYYCQLATATIINDNINWTVLVLFFKKLFI